MPSLEDQKAECLELLKKGWTIPALAKQFDLPEELIEKWDDKIKSKGEKPDPVQIELDKIDTDIGEINEISTDVSTDVTPDELEAKIKKSAEKLVDIAPKCIANKDLAESFNKVADGLSKIQTSIFGKPITQQVAVMNGIPDGLSQYLSE